jgi:hypothetical protein
VPTHFLWTLLGKSREDLSDRPLTDGLKDNSDVPPSNIIEPTMHTLSANNQQEFEEHNEHLLKEAHAKFSANFKVDRNQKVVQQRATNFAHSDLLQLPPK